MTLKEGADPPLVHASYATAEPEFDLNAPIATSVVIPQNPPATAPPARPAAKISTTTTHQVPPPPRPVASVNPNGFGRESCATTCPNCHQQVRTRVRHLVDGGTIVAVIALLLLFWPLFWLPLVIPGCKSTHHYCAHCNYRIAKEDCCS
ncbi:hypothetical protein MHU86_14882 [Fragilaria crotonensis]|nr:hypothetical protein MHU86_14882 [Fragilaria crotonensis]